MERTRIYEILEGRDPEYGRSFAIFSTIVILLGAFNYAIGTLPEQSPGTERLITLVDVFVLSVFAAEYTARVITSPRRMRYIFSFWGIIDLAAFLPVLLLGTSEMQAARILRVILLARLLKLMRITHAFDILVEAMEEIWEQLCVFLLIMLIVLFLAATGIYYLEREAQPGVFSSVPHSMWWAVATLTTVGYGDIVPVTVGGKVFTGIVLLIGLAVVAVPTGLISAALVSKTSNRKNNSKEGRQ